MDAPLCRLCEKRHYGSCAEPRYPAKTSQGKPARKKPMKRKAPDTGPPLFASAVIHIPVNQDAPRLMRPAEQLPVSDRITALEQIVDELLAGKRKRSEYMKAYMRDRRASDGV